MSFGVSDILFGGWGDAWNDAMGLYHELGSEAIEMVQQNIIGPAVEATRAAFTPDVPADVAIELEEIVATAPQEAVTATLSHVSEMMHDMPEFDGRVGTFDMTSAEDLNEVLQTLRNVQWTKEMDSLNMDAPAYVRQGDTWLSRQTISIEDAWGSTDALDGTGMTPFDVAVYDNLAEEVPDMVELMEMKTVPITGDFGTAASTTAGKITEFVTQGGSGDWPGEDVGGETAEEIEASGRVSEPISVDYENINTEELNSLVEDQMERVGFEIDNSALAFEEGAALAEGVTWAMIGVQVGYMVVGGGVLIGINFFQQWIYEKFNIPTGITFLGQWLIEQSDEMTREYWAHHPTGMQETAQFAFGYWQLEPGYRVPAQIVVSEQGMKSVTIRYWDADTVPAPQYYHLDRGGTITGKSSDELVTNYGHNDKENEHWLAIDRHQTFEGGRFEYLQNAPVKQLPDVDDYLAVFSVGDDSYRITRTSILAQAFLLFSFEDRYKNDPYLLTNLPHVYVWFRDNGLVGQKPPPRNMYDMAVNYLDKPLSRTNMWIKARVMLFDIRDSQRWLVLSIDEGVHNFWFRWGVDGPLLRDSAKIRASCILANHKILRTVLDAYSGGQTGETAADAWARRFRTSGYNPSTIPPEFSGGESINPMDPPNFDQTAQVPAPPEPSEPSEPAETNM